MSTEGADFQMKIAPENHVIFGLLAAAILPACLPMAQDRPAYLGSWSCLTSGGPEVTFTGSRYTEDGIPVGIETVADYGNNFAVDLSDGSRVSLFDVTDTTMTLHRPAMGISYSCRRT